MKTSFKRILSVVIALCVLLASATWLMSMTASADDSANELWADNANTKAFNLTNTSGGAGYLFFLDPDNKTADNANGFEKIYDAYFGITTGETVKFSFDYFNDNPYTRTLV